MATIGAGFEDYAQDLDLRTYEDTRGYFVVKVNGVFCFALTGIWRRRVRFVGEGLSPLLMLLSISTSFTGFYSQFTVTPLIMN